MKNTSNAIIPLILTSLLCGCASAPTAETVRDIPAGTPVYVAAKAPERGAPKTLTDGEGMLLLASGGTAAGALGGGFLGIAAAFTCGPLAPFCAAGTVPAGVIGGGVVGMTAGAIEGASIGISAEDAEALEKILETSYAEFTDPDSLARAFDQEASPYWVISEDDQAAGVTISVEEINVKQDNEEFISFEVVLGALVDYGDGKNPRRLTMTQTTEQRQVKSWLENDGSELNREIHVSVERCVADLVYFLADSIVLPTTAVAAASTGN